METDESLVHRLAAGERAAVATLFARHRDFVFRVALGLVGRRDEAVDIVQDVFVALIETPPRLRAGGGQLTTWLYRVARNRALDGRRRLARAGARSEKLPPPRETTSPEDALLAAERRAALLVELRTLPPRPREVFVLRIGLGLSVEQTSRLAGCRPGAVRRALHKAGRMLRERMSAARERREKEERDEKEEERDGHSPAAVAE